MTILTIKSLFIGALAVSFNLAASQVEIDRIEQAAGLLNTDALTQFSNDFTGYDKAFANYRLAISASLTNQPALAKQAADQAITLLEEIELTEPNNVEVKALLAQVYGYKIALEPMKGAYYGPKSGRKLAQAEALSPSNPRVLLIKGISAYSTPGIFGGNTETAYNAFNLAINEFSKDTQSNYHWGYAEAYTWRGKMHQQQGEQQKAQADWQHALQIDPNNGWAQSLLNATN